MNISQEELTQPILEEDVSHFAQETDPAGKSKLDGEEILQPPLPELKSLPPWFEVCIPPRQQSHASCDQRQADRE